MGTRAQTFIGISITLEEHSLYSKQSFKNSNEKINLSILIAFCLNFMRNSETSTKIPLLISPLIETRVFQALIDQPALLFLKPFFYD